MQAQSFGNAQMSKTIQLRHVPDALHCELKARAALAGLSLSALLLEELRHIAQNTTSEKMIARLKHRKPYLGKRSPTEVLRQMRSAGDGRLRLPSASRKRA